MTVVVDASVLVESLVEGPLAGLVDQRLYDEKALWAPHLIDAEVGHALRAGVRRGELSVSAASDALDELARLPIERAPHVELARTAWDLRHNVSYYDALYVALAAALNAPLVTLDARLAAAPGLPALVECLAPTEG